VTTTQKRATPKGKPERFFTKKDFPAKLIPQCAKEYEKRFGHAWSDDPLCGHKGASSARGPKQVLGA
jgi:hypothetical protein